MVFYIQFLSHIISKSFWFVFFMNVSYKETNDDNNSASVKDSLKDGFLNSPMANESLSNYFQYYCENTIKAYQEKNKDAFEMWMHSIFDFFEKMNYQIYIDNAQSEIINILKELDYNNFINTIMCDHDSEFFLNLIIIFVFYIRNIDPDYLNNSYVLPILINTYFHKNEMRNYIISILFTFLPSQLSFDPNFERFFPDFLKIVESIDDESIKIKLISVFIHTSPDLSIYYPKIVQLLPNYLKNVFVSEEELSLYNTMIKNDNNVYEYIVQSGIRDKIFSTLQCGNNKIIKMILEFVLIVFTIDENVLHEFDFIDYLILFIDSEKEEYSMFALNFFTETFPISTKSLLEKIDIDLLWSILYDGLTEASFEMKKITLSFVLRLIQCSNDDLTLCIIQSDICEIGKCIITSDNEKMISQYLDFFEYVFHLVERCPKFYQEFSSNFQEGDFGKYVEQISNEDIKVRAFALLETLSSHDG
ncbi:hypothetical protein TRFO_01126 [Tritrichomonas foetus]|uniref:Uncharacterized protein n=1 Tax=Tritrichomonas foetus TaxID=1144522 RepID=A0A1J4KIY5_9EUKA|nr:hypothetical protein TRFO_01126 [Tritrichomonas foetus]|eukprot:OHT11195.1 hypothetical protein TRFO_01126 [Tritrichomonas foetus]